MQLLKVSTVLLRMDTVEDGYRRESYCLDVYFLDGCSWERLFKHSCHDARKETTLQGWKEL